MRYGKSFSFKLKMRGAKISNRKLKKKMNQVIIPPIFQKKSTQEYSAETEYQIGLTLIDVNDNLAISHFENAAKKGHTEAMFQLAEKMSKPSKKNAFYKRAAELGHPMANYKLGTIYETQGNLVDSYKCYEKASNEGVAKATDKIIKWHETNQNADLAINQSHAAASKGHQTACALFFHLIDACKSNFDAARYLASLYQCSLPQSWKNAAAITLGFRYLNIGQPGIAQKWHKKACDSEGILIIDGLKKDLKSKIFYKAGRIAKAFFEKCQNHLDLFDAVRYFSQAANLDHPDAQIELAYIKPLSEKLIFQIEPLEISYDS